MAFLFPSPTTRHLIFIFGQLTILAYMISGKSIWDPFCREDILYTPYVRVFHRGRTGTLLRDRGPGFIDITGLQDIYVCTNGLVMMYYTKTRGMGEVFEQGELHWTPHHCELYNPSPNNGMPADHPKKTLLSILLIGHPQDYRKPALQMFTAPMYDVKYRKYVNMTSLIMMGRDGECIIEKGVEKARLRVRNQEPQHLAAIPFNESKPPIFCQLDAQRKLGQRGIITLAKPGKGGMVEGDLYKFIGRPPGFKDTPLQQLNLKGQSSSNHKRETGSTVVPRYHASDSKEMFPGELANYAEVADEVYAALISDRKMRFVGCLRYPDFNYEQMIVLEKKKLVYEVIDVSTTELLLSESSNNSFWTEVVTVPWPDAAEPKTTGSRFSLYLGVDVNAGDVEGYNESYAKVNDSMNELLAKKLAKAEEAEILVAEANLLKEKMIFSLWPLKKIYGDIFKYVRDLEFQAKEAVIAVHNVTGCLNSMPSFEGLGDPESKEPIVVSHWKKLTLLNVSQSKYERRYEPYNRELVKQYDQLVNETAILSMILTKKSIAVGPMISNSEALIERHRVFIRMLRKSITDLQNAIIQMEKTGKPVDIVPVDPFEKQYVDIMIEIADAVKEDGTPIEDNLQARACYVLAAQNVTCKGIKPTSLRAGRLLKNRQGKGLEWPVDDMWRGKVLDHLEEIFHNVCPYINQDFASSISKIIKGYLLADPLGTGLKAPIPGSRLESHDHQYQEIVYNMTYNETNLENMTETLGEGKLRTMQPFWEQIILVLKDCQNRVIPLQFWHNDEADKPPYVTFRKFFHNNNTEAFFDVDDLMMQEKADMEYVFNWAVEMNWRIFATVLGACMPRYEKRIPLVSARFYALYSQDFLHPLRQIWMSNRDNPVLHTILGNYHFQNRAERWTKVCMESAFVDSGDRNYRPPRNLYVNAFTEMNYFVTGPLAGTSGILSVVDNNL